ncbi:hypothetical protein R5R35_002038 [Gryllus longicercus]|uniref:Uncharacterized protein n=1 Tax=Gryllus longicercus TaxID=2509291 RepID=A0AAN9VBA0_9ORTH
MATDLTDCTNCAEMRVKCVEVALKDLCDRIQKASDKLNEVFGPLE